MHVWDLWGSVPPLRLRNTGVVLGPTGLNLMKKNLTTEREPYLTLNKFSATCSSLSL